MEKREKITNHQIWLDLDQKDIYSGAVNAASDNVTSVIIMKRIEKGWPDGTYFNLIVVIDEFFEMNLGFLFNYDQITYFNHPPFKYKIVLKQKFELDKSISYC